MAKQIHEYAIGEVIEIATPATDESFESCTEIDADKFKLGAVVGRIVYEYLNEKPKVIELQVMLEDSTIIYINEETEVAYYISAVKKVFDEKLWYAFKVPYKPGMEAFKTFLVAKVSKEAAEQFAASNKCYVYNSKQLSEIEAIYDGEGITDKDGAIPF